jgi:hypothetical protein
MKRVERRGTLESQQQQNANQSTQQQQQQQQHPSASHPNLPLSQGSDRFIHRSDTILTHQPSHNPFSQNHSQSLARGRGTRSSSVTQANIRSSLPSLNPSSASSNAAQVPVPQSTKHSSHHHPQPPQSPPPSITALKEGQDDDNNDQDPDQLPISNVGRGGSGAPIRSSSRNARVRGGSGPRPTPPVTRSSDNVSLDGTPNKKSPLGSSNAIGGGVKSGLEVEEMDADADADAEAEAELESEAEAEILGAVAATSRNRTDEEGGDDGDGEADADADAELLEAVDAAEANSSSSHGGERMRMKSES